MLEAYDVVADNLGVLFSPASCAHTYTYNSDGNLQTDTCVDLYSRTRVQTFTYTTGKLTAVSAWVQQ